MSAQPDSRSDEDLPSGRIVRRGLGVLGLAIRTQPRPFALSVAGAALYASMTVASAVVLGRVTDVVILPAFADAQIARGTVAAAAAAIVGVAVLKAIGIVTRRAAATYMQMRLHAIFRRRVAAHLHRLPLAWHRRHSTGQLLSNAGADVQAMFGPIAPLPFSVGALLLLAITGVALIITDPALAAIGFVLAPLVAVANGAYNRATEAPAATAQRLRGALAEVAHESFDGALVVKTLGREAEETARFTVAAQRLRDELIRLGRLRAIFSPTIEALPTLGTLAVLLVGALRVAGGHLSAGEVVQFVYLFTLLAFPMSVIGYLFEELPTSVAGWERIRAVLSAAPDPGELPAGQHRDDGQRRPGSPAALDIERLTFRFADAPVLQELTLRIRPGAVTAITGPTGVGKSSLASLLVRLADPDEGWIRIDGRDLGSIPRAELSRDAAIVFQHTFLFDDSVRDNITLGGDFSDAEVERACVLAQADGFIRRLASCYDTRVGERGAALSGGQRQRIALARALIRQPRLLILDDATSSVDPTVEAAILQGLRRARLPSTVVLIAYRSAALALADDVIFLDGGRVHDRGAHHELVRRAPAYAQMVTAYDRAAGLAAETP